MPKRILVPLDGSEQSAEAFDFALGEFGDEEVVLVHVIDPLASAYSGGYGVNPYSMADDIEDTKGVAVELIEKHTEKAKESGVTATGEHVLGQPAESIIKYAEEKEIDHIVIGSHGRTGVSRILLGSVAEKVVRRSPVPVTVVR